MNFELSEREARLLRGQLVRHIVELEDELARTTPSMLERALASEIRTLREVYGRLTALLDPDSSSAPSLSAAKYAP